MAITSTTSEPIAYLLRQQATPEGQNRIEIHENQSLSIGRSSTCDIQQLEAGVSRLHARIFASKDGLTVADLGSRNGTYVNGHRIKSTILSSGDLLRLGGASFTVKLQGVATATSGEFAVRLTAPEEKKRSPNLYTAMILSSSRNIRANVFSPGGTGRSR